MKIVYRYAVVAVAVAVLIAIGYRLAAFRPAGVSKNTANAPVAKSPSATSSGSVSEAVFAMPVDRAAGRITKKPFGIKVAPGHSPVNPERFTGYHAGVDFEILSGEENIDVPVYAICSGTLAEKIVATGYGGVAVQKCELSGRPITVIYGHIKISSVSFIAGDFIKKGNKIAVLGSAYSAETGGERKHLHLGIHKGSGIDLLGYVQTPDELKNWINFADYMSS